MTAIACTGPMIRRRVAAGHGNRDHSALPLHLEALNHITEKEAP